LIEESKETDESEEEHASPPKRRRVPLDPSRNFVNPSPSRHELPDSLTMDAFHSMDVHELAAIKQAIFVEKDDLIVSARAFYQQKQLEEPDTISLLNLGNLNLLLLAMAFKLVQSARKERSDRIPGGLFLPDGNHLLVAWIGEGKRYSKWSRLHACNYDKHPSNDPLWLSDKAASYMRHIYYYPQGAYYQVSKSYELLCCFAPWSFTET
jgi:hypothetical protein